MPKKAGRPKYAGVIREPNGRPSRTDRVQYVQRELAAIRAGVIKPEWGTPLGELARAGRVTPSQYAAGTWYADARKAADAALSLPPRNPTAQDMNAVHGASNREDDEASIRAKRRVIEICAKAEAVLGHGSRRYRAVMWVCVFERRCEDHEQLLALLEGLSLLAHYRTARRAA